MIILIGAIVVFASILGGFTLGGGNVGALMHGTEVIVICGSALGATIIMSPGKVLKDLLVCIVQAFKGQQFSRRHYEELLKALFEIFIVGRRNGLIAMEDHLTNPQSSNIFSKYPSFLQNKNAVTFLSGALRPIIDGGVKPSQLKTLLDVELNGMEEEQHKPASVLAKIGDSLPGFGIVAAVLGIVITMGSISGPIELIGKHVASALVGTFLGILLAYGFVNPLAVKLEFNSAATLAYVNCISVAVVAFANAMPPIMALEMARRGLAEEVRPSSDELEEMLRAVTAGEKSQKQ
jgi:chemotaxis protein MotA